MKFENRLTIAFLFVCASVFAQDTIESLTTHLPILVDTGVSILNATNNQVINGVPNTVTGALFTLVVTGVIRFFEKKKLKKKLNQNK